jgi:hypothetical protein
MTNWDWEFERIFGDALKVREETKLLNLNSTELIGSNPHPHTRFDQLMSNPCHTEWSQWTSFYNGWLEGRAWLLQELKDKLKGEYDDKK